MSNEKYVNKKSPFITWWVYLMLSKINIRNSYEIKRHIKNKLTPIEILEKEGYLPYNICQFIRVGFVWPALALLINLFFSVGTIFFAGSALVYASISLVLWVMSIDWATGGLSGIISIAVTLGLLYAVYKAFKHIIIPVTGKVINSKAMKKVSQVHDATICKSITYVKKDKKDENSQT